jgi:hypothetical protein
MIQWGSAQKGSRRTRRRAVYSRVFLNGVDISRDCFAADCRNGVAHVYLRTAEGRLRLVGLGAERRIARGVRRGRVRIERRR